jgi:hypothetical protein
MAHYVKDEGENRNGEFEEGLEQGLQPGLVRLGCIQSRFG